MRIKFTNPRNPRRSLWREWYAWRPVKVGQQWVWLETLETRKVFKSMHYEFDGYWATEYRYITDSK